MKTTDWISVKTDSPKIPKGGIWSLMVWIYDEKYGQRMGCIGIDGQWRDTNNCCLNHVTHWMSLPDDPPKEKIGS